MTSKEPARETREKTRSKPFHLPDPAPEVMAAFKHLSTPLLCDALDSLHLRGRCMEMSVRPVWPGARFVGIAATAEFVPSARQSDRDLQDLLSLLGRLPPARAVVIGMSGLGLAAAMGYLTSRVARQLGCAGAVVDGPVRNVEAIRTLGFPVFASGCVPSSVRGRMALASLQQPVSAGGVLVNPGDVVMGDESGVVVVPRERLDEVLAESGRLASRHLLWQEQLDNGLHPMDFVRKSFETEKNK